MKLDLPQYYWQLGLEHCAYDDFENGVYFFLLGETDFDAFPELLGNYGLSAKQVGGSVVITRFPNKALYEAELEAMQKQEEEDGSVEINARLYQGLVNAVREVIAERNTSDDNEGDTDRIFDAIANLEAALEDLSGGGA